MKTWAQYGISPAKSKTGFTIVELLIVIVVIGILAAITIVAYNGVTNKAKTSAMFSELAQWKKKAELYKIDHNIECPDNYVFVYGNSVLGTSDFCIMKYEAKIQGNDDGTTTYSSSMVAESRATGTPWVNITQTNAITKAAALGSGFHVTTEAEWMTVAADILSVKYNWSGGEVGSGYVYQGHVNNNPSNELAASADDTDNLYGITGGIGATPGTNSRRTLYLSSGDVIWDFSGNVHEWTQQAIGTPSLVVNSIGAPDDTGVSYKEWTLGTLNLGNMPNISKPSALASLSGLNNITSWDSTQGIGRIYANYNDTATRAFVRGGYYSSSPSGAQGVLMLNVNNSPTATYYNVSFRAVTTY